MNLDRQMNAQIQLLGDPEHRAIVRILDEAAHSLHVEELSRRLVDRETALVDTAEYENRLDETILSLHHNRLPRLAEAELIDYDREANRAACREPPAPDAERYEITSIDELISLLPTSNSDDSEEGIKEITGRQSVIEYGRKLADEAEEELFCMYVGTDLLEDECIKRAEQAIDCDVTMYMGSQNPEVRELTRKHLPEATIWEPQLDWLNTPTYPRVGRLVMIDRRKVMLAILEEPTDDEPHPEETAVAAEGEEHPFVVLVRDLLGPRLDHLDYQSEDFRSELSP